MSAAPQPDDQSTAQMTTTNNMTTITTTTDMVEEKAKDSDRPDTTHEHQCPEPMCTDGVVPKHEHEQQPASASASSSSSSSSQPPPGEPAASADGGAQDAAMTSQEAAATAPASAAAGVAGARAATPTPTPAETVASTATTPAATAPRKRGGSTMAVSAKVVGKFLVCPLCRGYFRDAHTIAECLHTFCKSCIFKYYLNVDSVIIHDDCPVCHISLKPNPLVYVKQDGPIQTIVDRLLPQAAEREKTLEREFYKARNLPVPTEDEKRASSNLTYLKYDITKKERMPTAKKLNQDHYSSYVCFRLTRDPTESDPRNLPSKYFKTTTQATIHTVQLIIMQLLPIAPPTQVEVRLNGTVLGSTTTMQEVITSHNLDPKNVKPFGFTSRKANFNMTETAETPLAPASTSTTSTSTTTTTSASSSSSSASGEHQHHHKKEHHKSGICSQFCRTCCCCLPCVPPKKASEPLIDGKKHRRHHHHHKHGTSSPDKKEVTVDAKVEHHDEGAVVDAPHDEVKGEHS
ncbi:polycomb group RING finger protein 1-like [Pelomyxa schiedti]|nr:polycomb group RING finger protein 1-like [Pelomyxa schiedti]